MFTQFRVAYPNGSLITELSTIDHGKYVVRCLVQVEGITLVTALAAAETVELAEDKARSRALTILGIETINAKKNNHSVSTDKRPPTAVKTEAVEAIQETQPLETVEVNNTSSLSSSPLESEEVVSAAVILELASPQQDKTPVRAEEEVQELLPKDEPVKPKVDNKTDTATSFSDVIARTNSELSRLGWDNKKGRDFLLETYGKRSRQLLTDEELLDFLERLESEPTPE